MKFLDKYLIIAVIILSAFVINVQAQERSDEVHDPRHARSERPAPLRQAQDVHAHPDIRLRVEGATDGSGCGRASDDGAGVHEGGVLLPAPDIETSQAHAGSAVVEARTPGRGQPAQGIDKPNQVI